MSVLVIILAFFGACILVVLLQCRPLTSYWNPAEGQGVCLNPTQLGRWTGICNILTDFVVLSLTLPMTWQLRMSSRQKLTLSAIFLLGAL